VRRNWVVIALTVILLALLALLPVITSRDSILNLAILTLLGVILASSWNILGGYTGQTNLGHAAFFGLGTLATRLLWLKAGWPLFPSLLAGGVVAVAFALLIGAPAFKLRGVYFAIGTLALAQVGYATVGNVFPEITSLPAKALATYQLEPRYYLFLALAVLTVGTAAFLVRSRQGLGMMAVREDEDAAESLGVSAFRHKLLALGASAFLAGLAGGGFAYYYLSYYPQMPFGPGWTFDALMMAYIGGQGTIVGPIIGALFFVVTREQLALQLAGVQLNVLGRPFELGEVHQTVFGILFILVVLFLPGGLVEAWERIRRALTRRAKRKEVKLASQGQAS
jgi:branched-chain amino acid transport system permease protein